MSVQYDSQGIWSLHITSAYINCLQNTGCWKWVFVILIILVFHLNLNFVVFVILIVSIFQFKLTFVESLMTKYHFLRWTFEFLPNFQCFSKFKDVITLGSKVPWNIYQHLRESAFSLLIISRLKKYATFFPQVCAACTYEYLIIAN